MIAGGEGGSGGGVSEIGEGDREVQTSNCKISNSCDKKYSIGMTVNNIIITLGGD